MVSKLQIFELNNKAKIVFRGNWTTVSTHVVKWSRGKMKELKKMRTEKDQ